MFRADIADFFLKSTEASRYTAMGNAKFIDALFETVLDRRADAVEAKFWIARLDDGTVDRGDVLLSFMNSDDKIALVGVMSTSIDTL